ncbi:hypothetical protein [Streptomyces javensis]|uniref:Secreted protein n=1 Tax=Streptomyces javensis TaxID=114698 RepID=A0ABS0RK05_9ACTN|nr:hypothetical protein [Streptomyces javensis]MBI0317595.1 hypothetical protein [Streptomyces javensis]
MRRGLRLAAVLTVVLVALTGFKGRGHGHGGGGGGCSSSSSHHSSGSGSDSGSGSSSGSGGYSDSDDESSTTGAGSGGSRYRDYDDDDYGDSASSGSSGGSASSYEPQTTVVTCAEKGKGKSGRPAATVKVRNRSGATDTYLVDMNFQDRNGLTLTSGRADVRVPAGKSRTVRVPLDDPSVVGTVVRCEVVSVL